MPVPQTEEEGSPGSNSFFLTNAVTVCEAENALHLIESDMLLNLHHVLVEAWALPAEMSRVTLELRAASTENRIAVAKTWYQEVACQIHTGYRMCLAHT